MVEGMPVGLVGLVGLRHGTRGRRGPAPDPADPGPGRPRDPHGQPPRENLWRTAPAGALYALVGPRSGRYAPTPLQLDGGAEVQSATKVAEQEILSSRLVSLLSASWSGLLGFSGVRQQLQIGRAKRFVDHAVSVSVSVS